MHPLHKRGTGNNDARTQREPSPSVQPVASRGSDTVTRRTMARDGFQMRQRLSTNLSHISLILASRIVRMERLISAEPLTTSGHICFFFGIGPNYTGGCPVDESTGSTAPEWRDPQPAHLLHVSPVISPHYQFFSSTPTASHKHIQDGPSQVLQAQQRPGPALHRFGYRQ